ncbi:hypothetical protein EDD85DRAFT_98392 [Armillaria nabsnona]|nr:hypothetical protein EDD85DRAFT_98392 [Armillaria nabsnona]
MAQLIATHSTSAALPFCAPMPQSSSSHTVAGSTSGCTLPASTDAISRRPRLPLVDPGVQFPCTAQDVRDTMQQVLEDLPSPNSDIYVLDHPATNTFTVLALRTLPCNATYLPTGAVLLHFSRSGWRKFRKRWGTMKLRESNDMHKEGSWKSNALSFHLF